jgi:hypothetical protein
MSCGLIDVGCHIQSAAYEWWADIGLLNKVLIVGGVLALVLGVSWSLLTLVKRLGGWPAALGAVAVIVGVVLAFLPRKPKGAVTEHFPEGHPDTKGPFEFGVNKTKPAKKKKRPTIFDRS